MPKLEDTFVLPLPRDQALWACREAVASTGWALTEATPTKLVTLNRNLGRRCNIEVHLGGIEAGQTRVTVRGSVSGYFLGKELRSMVNQLRNAIEVSAHRLSTTGADNASRQHVQPEQPQFTAGWFRNPEGSGERYWDGTRWTDSYRPSAQASPPPPSPPAGSSP